MEAPRARRGAPDAGSQRCRVEGDARIRSRRVLDKVMAELRSTSRLQVSVADAVARIRLMHPPLNIIDIAMMDDLATVLREVETRDDVTIILFGGDHRAFSAGVDIPAHQPESIDEMLRK